MTPDLEARIAVDPCIMVGKPVIRGTRLTVEHVLNLLASDWTTADVLREYPGLDTEDVKACLAFASRVLADTTYVPATV